MQDQIQKEVRTIVVTGVASRAQAPDVGSLRFTASCNHTDTDAAQQDVDKRLTALTAGLVELGIEKRFIATMNLSVDQKRNRDSGEPTGEYVVSHSLEVRVPFAKIGKAISLGTPGKLTISGPKLEVSNAKAIVDELLDDALLNGRKQAERIARTLGGRINPLPLKTVPGGQESSSYGSGRMGALESFTPTIEAGEQQLSARVQLTFEIIGGSA